MTHGPFTDLKIWQNGIDLADLIYEVTKDFPKEERYGLASQAQRAAVSIPSNIAEGSQRGTDRDFANFVRIAKGSLAELLTQMIIVEKRGYILLDREKSIFSHIETLDKMIYRFIQKLTTSS